MPEKKILFIYLKLKKENNVRTMVLKIFVVIMYLIETFKMRLLLIAESPKRSNSTFK